MSAPRQPWWRRLLRASRQQAQPPVAESQVPAAQPRLLEMGDIRAELVKAELARGRARVSERVEGVKSLSEREILACGQVLATLVDEVRDQIDEARHAMQASSARSEALTSRFISEMQQDLQTQEAAVGQVLQLADGIEEAVHAIRRLTRHAEMLALNSKIEAGRFGDQGKGFAVIAENLRELSRTIETAAGQVDASVGAVREGLPPVSDCASSMQNRTRAFIDHLADQARSQGDLGTNGLDVVIALSNEALSHLTFQDAASQKLSTIAGVLEQVDARIERVLAGETELEDAPDDETDDQQLPGQMILF